MIKKIKKLVSKSKTKKAKPAKSDVIVPVKAEDILTRKNSDGTVAAMRLDTEDYFFTFDGIAAEIWTLIDNKTSIETIKGKIKKKYNVPEARFEKDVAKLLKDLKSAKLVDF